jgi:hypothetical protein
LHPTGYSDESPKFTWSPADVNRIEFWPFSKVLLPVLLGSPCGRFPTQELARSPKTVLDHSSGFGNAILGKSRCLAILAKSAGGWFPECHPMGDLVSIGMFQDTDSTFIGSVILHQFSPTSMKTNDRLIQHCYSILTDFDQKCTPDQQQTLEALKAYLRKLRGPHFYCWSCNQSHSECYGISLDETEEYHVCDSCWNKMQPYWRLMARKWFMDNPGPRNEIVEAIVHQMIKPRQN